MRLSEALANLPRQHPKLTPLELPLESAPGIDDHDAPTKLINCFAEKAGKGGKIPWPLYPAHGLSSFSTLSNGAGCRGMHALTSEMLVVSARLLFSMDAVGTSTVKGGIASDGLVFFATNQASPAETAIVADGLSFSYINGVLATLTVPQPASTVAFIDGHLLFGIETTGRVYYSDVNDISTITSFFTAEGSADKLRRVFVHNRTIFLLGFETTELWNSTGDENAPFQRSPGAFYQIGCAAAATAVSLNSGCAWITDTGFVVKADLGGGFQRISTHPVERSIAAVTDKSTISGWVDEVEGHEFYYLAGTGFTWVYDTVTGLWHQRESLTESRFRGSCYARFNEKRYVGDFEGDGTDSYVYEMAKSNYAEGSNALTMVVQFPVHAWPYSINCKRLFVDMIPGVGTTSSDPHLSNPQLMVRASVNGGKTFYKEWQVPIGTTGQHWQRTRIGKLGRTNEDGFVIQLRCSAGVIRAFTGLAGEIEAIRR